MVVVGGQAASDLTRGRPVKEAKDYVLHIVFTT